MTPGGVFASVFIAGITTFLFIVCILLWEFIIATDAMYKTFHEFEDVPEDHFYEWLSKKEKNHEIYKRLHKNYEFEIFYNSLMYKIKFLSFDGNNILFRHKNKKYKIPISEVTLCCYELRDFIENNQSNVEYNQSDVELNKYKIENKLNDL